MNPYNCRITRVIPKDHILQIAEPQKLLDGRWCQTARFVRSETEQPTILSYVRYSRYRSALWGEWQFWGIGSRLNGVVLGSQEWPMFTVSSILHDPNFFQAYYHDPNFFQR